MPAPSGTDSTKAFAALIETELQKDPQSCALIAAARAGDPGARLSTLALQYGDSVNAQNTSGDTALHVASAAGNQELALFLLSRHDVDRHFDASTSDQGQGADGRGDCFAGEPIQRFPTTRGQIA